MSSRPIVLVFLLLVLIITSQFEWKQQIEADSGNPAVAVKKKQLVPEKEETVKEKIILSQEKSIQQLNELVQSLQLQLLHCRGSNNTILSSKNLTNDDVSDAEDRDADQH